MQVETRVNPPSELRLSNHPTIEQNPHKPAANASVLILTKNEESNIAACLDTLQFSDDIVVLDSYSTDRTLEIAKTYPNVRIVQRVFDTWSRHSNWALDNIKFKHKWIYSSDADEQVTPELRDEILRVVAADATEYNAYWLRYKNMFMGRWIRRGGIYPVWIMRLYRHGSVRYEARQTNAHPLVNGAAGELQEHFVHYSFNKGLVPWFKKHNLYSAQEAEEALRVTRQSALIQVKGVFRGDRPIRRRSLKNLSFFLPGRAAIRFVYMYFLRLGFLDGLAGFHYAMMIAMYEFWISLKVKEQRSKWQDQTHNFARKLLAKDEATPPVSETETPLVEVMIPTLNEARHIAEAVANARKLGPVFVLDSFSNDGTQEIARQAGATVVEHKFENYSAQKNWGLDNLPFKGKWVFILDADERITPTLRKEILSRLGRRPAANGFYISRKLLAMGRKVEHGGLYPAWNLRLFKRGKARYEDRSVHEHVICEGIVDSMHFEMLHIRCETISQYLDKHIRYADMESDEWLKWKLGKSGDASAGKLFQSDLKFRQWVRREIWPVLPFRPLIRFVWMFFFRFGFLDGHAGWFLAQLMMCYEYMITLLYRDKVIAAREADKGTLL